MAVAAPAIATAVIGAATTYYATEEAKQRQKEAIKAAKPPAAVLKPDNLAAERLRRQRLAGASTSNSSILTSPLGATGTVGGTRNTLLGK